MSDGERPVSLSIQMRTNSSVVMPGYLARSARSAVFSRAEDLHGEVLHAGHLLGDHHFGGVRIDGLHTVGARF